MQAQHYAKTKMDYLVFTGYNSLAAQGKTVIDDSDFKDSVSLGTISVDANGVSHRTVTVSVYKGDEVQPRAKLSQVFYSNDANRFVVNGSSTTSSISMYYDADNDKLYAKVDGYEKELGGGIPVGTVITWASNSVPTEGGIWLECNGQSCAAYPKLIAVLGKNTVPDYRGRFLETSAVVGVVKEAGLPNITGRMGSDSGTTEDSIRNGSIEPFTSADQASNFIGAFKLGPMQQYVSGNYWTNNGKADNAAPIYIDFDASRSSAIYGKSTTVQPASITVRRFIKAA